MSVRAVLKRMQIVLDIVEKNRYPSKKDLLELLDYEVGCSPRTFDRVLETLRDDFGCEILYDSGRKGYYIDESQSIHLSSIKRLISLSGVLDVVRDHVKTDNKTLRNIHFEYEGIINGMDYIGPLLRCIKHHSVIEMIHQKYGAKEEKEYKVHPYLLKEYQGRWYLLGYVTAYDDYRTFGLDRIKKIKQTDQSFQPDEGINTATYFDDVIGLVKDMSDVEEVVLRFSERQGSFIKSQPLHKSQVVLADNEDGLLIKLKLMVNYELMQKIMMHGPEVTVIKPDWLVEDIKTKLADALLHYSG
jgi:predicted DNA-binding transcriptional regulator YafY